MNSKLEFCSKNKCVGSVYCIGVTCNLDKRSLIIGCKISHYIIRIREFDYLYNQYVFSKGCIEKDLYNILTTGL